MCFRSEKMEKLYVVTPLFNPLGYKSRHKLYNNFEKHMLKTKNIVLCTVECVFKGNTPTVRKQGKNHIVVTVESLDKFWFKENLINIGVSRLPKEAKYICWIDADLKFPDPNWASNTIELLKKYPVIQMFSEVDYIDHDGITIVRKVPSLMDGWLNGAYILNNGKRCSNPKVLGDSNKKYGWHGAPGGAWAYRKEIFEKIGGLVDFGIVGSGDSYSAFGMLGIVCSSVLSNSFKYNPDYVKAVKDWVDNAFKVVDGNIGVLDCIIYHNYHGETKDRQYWERNEILCKNQFSPKGDLYKNHQGLNQFIQGKPELEADIIKYFENRKEDNNYDDSEDSNTSEGKFLGWIKRIIK